MHGVKLPRLTTTSSGNHSKQPHRRGPSYSKRRAPLRRWIRRLGGCTVCCASVILFLLMSAVVFLAVKSWPGAAVSSAFDLGTDESPANVWRRGGERGGEHDAEEWGGGEIAKGLDLGAYTAMVGGDVAPPTSIADLGLPVPLRIYVYELPPSFNVDFLRNPRCASHLFAAEVAIHRALLQSPVRTLQPAEADFFFVPVYTACNFNTENGFPNLSGAPEQLRTAVELLAAEYQYWNRTNGRDHVFVATHDFGACFHAMEKAAVQAGVPQFLRNSIILQTFGQTNNHPCQDVDHIQIPPYVPSPLVLANWQPPESQNRTIFAYMSGKIEVHPKESVSGSGRRRITRRCCTRASAYAPGGGPLGAPGSWRASSSDASR
ncbi:Exostosin family protein [Klebsormidium nitens]|uniref:Exostosin family protein n=1 Tax=Klebsormidium nitens TaxID=105231 RepID=A0A0U9HNJ2_KLENI|nr:Exostosin family protein [Klebsormidium nitens]|eukprot:GAQ82511.1 Exostosin family protein [Klebsormidium nitens]